MPSLRQDTDPVPLADAVAELFGRVDALQAWWRRLDAAWREGWLMGHEAGYRGGYEQAERDMAAAWKPVAERIRETAGRPSHDELERRRWGPAGRDHFGDERPGDFPGRGGAA